MTKLLMVDTETGGLDPHTHSLLSVGLAVWEDGSIIDTLEVNIKHDTYNVTAGALRVNRIDLSQEEGKVTPSVAVTRIQLFISEHFEYPEKPTVVGQNVQFDMGFLKALFGHIPYEATFSHRFIDTASIARFLQLSGASEVRGSGLSDLIAYYNIQVEENERHTALGDCIVTAKVFNAMLDEMKGEF